MDKLKARALSEWQRRQDEERKRVVEEADERARRYSNALSGLLLDNLGVAIPASIIAGDGAEVQVEGLRLSLREGYLCAIPKCRACPGDAGPRRIYSLADLGEFIEAQAGSEFICHPCRAELRPETIFVPPPSPGETLLRALEAWLADALNPILAGIDSRFEHLSNEADEIQRGMQAGAR